MLRKSQKTLFRSHSPILAQNRRRKIFRKIDPCHILIHIIFYLHAKNQKILMTKFWENCKKPYFWAILGQKSAIMAKNGPIRFFSKNRALSRINYYGFATSCKKSENSNEPIWRKLSDARTDGRTHGHRLIYRTFTCGRSNKSRTGRTYLILV